MRTILKSSLPHTFANVTPLASTQKCLQITKVRTLSATCPGRDRLGRTLATYTRRHPELQASKFVIPQVPGTIARSKRVKGVLEVMFPAKKYMWPIFMFHPYAAGIAVAIYVQHWNFNPGKNGLILDSEHQLGAALTGADRRIVQRQLDELVRASPLADSAADECHWTSLRIAADPAVEGAGAITLQVREGGEVMSVGVARSNILNVPAGSEFAAGVVKARLRVELKSTPAQKTARADVESDLVLLQQLLATQPRRLVSATGSHTVNRTQSLVAVEEMPSRGHYFRPSI